MFFSRQGRAGRLTGLLLASTVGFTALQLTTSGADLAEKLGPGEAVVAAWSHSGVGVKTSKHLLVFDYIRATARSGGELRNFLDPSELPDIPVIVFVSHSHRDHHDPVIYRWADALPRVHYVVSEDVTKTSSFRKAELPGSRVTVVGADQDRRILDGKIRVRTIASTDQGVAFRVEVDGVDLLHTGDHALWAWQEENAAQMRRTYLDRLQRLVPEESPIDIAFLCSDLRLPVEARLSGAVDAVELLEPALVVPIHNYSRNGDAARVLRASLPENRRALVAPIRGPGTRVRYPEGGSGPE